MFFIDFVWPTIPVGTVGTGWHSRFKSKHPVSAEQIYRCIFHIEVFRNCDNSETNILSAAIWLHGMTGLLCFVWPTPLPNLDMCYQPHCPILTCVTNPTARFWHVLPTALPNLDMYYQSYSPTLRCIANLTTQTWDVLPTSIPKLVTYNHPQGWDCQTHSPNLVHYQAHCLNLRCITILSTQPFHVLATPMPNLDTYWRNMACRANLTAQPWLVCLPSSLNNIDRCVEMSHQLWTCLANGTDQLWHGGKSH